MIEIPYILAGAFTGFVVGFTGVGGGAMMTPILLILFGVSPVTAVATDLWFAAITKSFGAKMHYANGNIDWQVAKRLWMGSIPVALFVVLLVNLGVQLSQIEWMTTAIGVVLMITALGLLAAPWLYNNARNRRIEDPQRFKAAQPPLTIMSGVVLGLCVALTSVGAGALGSVFLLYLYPLRMNPHRLVATDIVHAIPLSVVAGSGYLLAGMVDWNLLVSLVIGSIPAVILGAYLAGKAKGRWIQVALSVTLVGAALKLLA